MKTVRTVTELRSELRGWHAAGLKSGFVPTMGALHDGHLSLVHEARRHSGKVVVSIFVNPTQFGPGEDFEKYPRDEGRDCALLENAGADLVYLPGVDEMYPEGDSTIVSVKGVSENFEGAHRPGHFDGVATVVAKLLLQCGPDVAVFGEKDYQQLAVIRRMVRDLFIPCEIIGAPIVRDEYGLALSSRNAYLSEASLQVARLLNKVLFKTADNMTRQPSDAPILVEAAKEKLLEAGFTAVDYFALVDAHTLEPIQAPDRPARLLVTARIQGVRLLDNAAVSPIL